MQNTICPECGSTVRKGTDVCEEQCRHCENCPWCGYEADCLPAKFGNRVLREAAVELQTELRGNNGDHEVSVEPVKVDSTSRYEDEASPEMFFVTFEVPADEARKLTAEFLRNQ